MLSPSPGNLPDPGIEPVSRALQAGGFIYCLSYHGSPKGLKGCAQCRPGVCGCLRRGPSQHGTPPFTTPKSPPHPSSLAPVRLRPALGSVRVLLGHVAHPSPRELLAHRRVLVVGLPSAIPRGSEGCPALEIKGCSSFPFGWSFGFRSPLIWACGSLVPLFFWGRLNPMDVAFIFLNFYF